IGERAMTVDGVLDLWHEGCTNNGWWGCKKEAAAGGTINPIQSASIRTSKSVSIKYGKVEVKAKLPKGDWIFPAIWMLPKSNAYGGW
ncbi:hypothetical protein BC833DRAFT_613287, partial [Globomyces pollinis-pini]